MGFALIVMAGFIVIKVTTGIYNTIRNFDPKSVVFAMGSNLKQDKNGYTNIVLLGDGGHVRDGADLVDTIIVASLDMKNKSASLLSIPRDYYVKSAQYGNGKINELYRNNKKILGEEKAYETFKAVTGEITGLDIQYYVRVDFNGFVDVVDSLGGINVDVKEAINDPFYPNETDNGYTLFQVNAGPQEMDGETALKFTRSRKTTSDFSRALRQQQVIMAIREKALSGKVLTDPSVIKKIYDSISKNLNTDISIREMITLASFASNFDRSKMVMKVIHDDPSQEGGFLYTPDRTLYNNMFVLVPDGDNLDLIHKYADLIFNKRDFFTSPATIEILNATKSPGVARRVASYLTRFGFNIVKISNLLDKSGKRKTVEKTFIRYNSWDVDAKGAVTPHNQPVLDALKGFIMGDDIPNDVAKIDDSSPDISIIIGSDHTLL